MSRFHEYLLDQTGGRNWDRRLVEKNCYNTDMKGPQPDPISAFFMACQIQFHPEEV